MGRKEQAAETEVALKRAARRVFADRGYLNTKITDITAEAGRATGSFYNHFASKEVLLEALLTDLLAEGDEAVMDPAHDADFSRRDSIRWHVAAFWRFYQRHIPEMIALRQAGTADPELGKRLQRILAEDNQHMLDHLSHVANPPGDPLLVITAMNGLLDHFAYTCLVAGGEPFGHELSDDEAIDFLTDLLHRGIAGTA